MYLFLNNVFKKYHPSYCMKMEVISLTEEEKGVLVLKYMDKYGLTQPEAREKVRHFSGRLIQE